MSEKNTGLLAIVAIILSIGAITISVYGILNEGKDKDQQETTEIIHDTTPPEKVTNLVLDNLNIGDDDIYFKVKWKHVFDNSGISHYKIYIDNSLSEIMNLGGLFYENNMMWCFADWYGDENIIDTFNIQVSAVDGAGNEGEKSDILTITIP